MIPGYKPFFETHPPATTATLLQNKRDVAGVADVAAPPRFEKTHDTDSLIERSAIRENDAGFDRDSANMAASRAYDRQRQSYEFAHPGRDTVMVEALYQVYLQNWQPTGPGDVPAVPPNTNRNGNLWRQWWAKIEHVTAADGRKEDS